MPDTDFNTWFPTSRHGTETVNVGAFGPHADNTAHTMTSLGYANLAAAKVDYPSATSMNDTSDWCAITEAIKLALKHEDPENPGEWLWNATGFTNNKAIFVPSAYYVINQPIRIENSQGVTMYSTHSAAQIYNQNTTPGENIALAVNAMSYSYFENMQFQARGTNAIAVDLNQTGVAGYTTNTNSFMFINCLFTTGGPNSIACAIGMGGYMGSEGTFIGCGATGIEGYGNATVGFCIGNPNALNYQFLMCGGTFCDEWIRVNTGGSIVIQNASLASNVKDLKVGGQTTVIGLRTESRYFCENGGSLTLIGCGQAAEGSNVVFLNNTGNAFMSNCGSSMGRICGEGSLIMDDSNVFSQSRPSITAIGPGSGAPPCIKITHEDSDFYTSAFHGFVEFFLDEDEVMIQGVLSTNMGASGGAAATNGVWVINKLTHNTLELVGSTYVADTYTSLGGGAYDASIGGGPRFHLRDILHPSGDIPTKQQHNRIQVREPVETHRQDFSLLWFDTGKTFDNLNAAGPVVFTLPDLYTGNHRGVFYKFVVLTAQTLKVQTFDFGAVSLPYKSSRIFRAGGYATAGTEISCNVVGATLEIYLADGDTSDYRNTDYSVGPPYSNPVGHRWVVRSETGTWTIAGTPRPPT